MDQSPIKISPPSGNVTFLFTEIEGGTMLAQLHPDSLSAALKKHEQILTDAVKKHNGFIFKIMSDAFCCAFEKSSDALRAAVDAQLLLCSENWNEAEIKVRMGIHSGEALWNGSEYAGYVALARSNRIMSAAHGGQIVVSSQVYSESEDEVAGSVTFIDLGERKLKDLNQPLRLYQVAAKGLKEEFPPLKTLDARPNNLPIQLNRFVGRDKEKEEVKELMNTTPLLTIIGTGGTGKTRLSLQAAAEMIDRFENGIWFVELAGITQPEFVVQAIASTLDISTDGKKDLTEVIKNYLKVKNTLIILDNCEHLIDKCAVIAQQLLTYCPKLKILASSREAIKIGGERTYLLPSMSLPDVSKNYNKDTLNQFESVQLFIDRAVNANPKFEITNSNAPAVAQLCHDLDGIPLAIELAAARVKAMPAEKILERLGDRFRLLTGGKRTSLPRQQTLKALIDWSYELLTENEKRVLQRLSVFQGGWKIDSAEAICSGEPIDAFDIIDLLSNLLDKSLVKFNESENDDRYGMLETIRQYSDAKLAESGERDYFQERHFRYFSEMVKDSEQRLTSSGQKACIEEIENDYENIREAIRWSLDNNSAEALKMCISLGKFWELRSYFEEGKNYFMKGIAGFGNAESEIVARSYYWIGFYLNFLAKHNEAIEYLEMGLKIFENEGIKDGEALCLAALGTIALQDGEFDKMESLTNKSLDLAREINNKSLIASNLRALGTNKLYQNLFEESRKFTAESLSIFTELGDRVQLAKIINNYGALEYLAANYTKSVEYWKESLAFREELGDRHGIAMSYTNLGSAYSMMQDFERSEEALKKSYEMYKQLGDTRMCVSPLNTMGNIANDTGEHVKSLGIFKETISKSLEVGEKYFLMKGIEGVANSYIGLEDFEYGCRFSALYMKMMLSLNINVTNLERERMESIKKHLKDNLTEAEFRRLWEEGENLSPEDAVRIVNEDQRALATSRSTTG